MCADPAPRDGLRVVRAAPHARHRDPARRKWHRSPCAPSRTDLADGGARPGHGVEGSRAGRRRPDAGRGARAGPGTRRRTPTRRAGTRGDLVGALVGGCPCGPAGALPSPDLPLRERGDRRRRVPPHHVPGAPGAGPGTERGRCGSAPGPGRTRDAGDPDVPARAACRQVVGVPGLRRGASRACCDVPAVGGRHGEHVAAGRLRRGVRRRHRRLDHAPAGCRRRGLSCEARHRAGDGLHVSRAGWPRRRRCRWCALALER